MGILNVANETEFTNAVLNATVPALVDFWAPWCGPCKMIAPELVAIAESYGDKIIIAKINVDDHQQLAGKYNVMSIPTMLLFKNGKEIKRIVGYHPRKELSAIIDGIM